jgi:hypothetical protein
MALPDFMTNSCERPLELIVIQTVTFDGNFEVNLNFTFSGASNPS